MAETKCDRCAEQAASPALYSGELLCDDCYTTAGYIDCPGCRTHSSGLCVSCQIRDRLAEEDD